MERMSVDFFDCVTASLGVFDKLALAACCTEMRVTLSDFFAEWDYEIATVCSASIDCHHPMGTFHMKRYDDQHFDIDFVRKWWPTGQATCPPTMVFAYNGRGCSAFEHGHMDADVTYRLDPMEDPTRDKIHSGKEIRLAVPLLSNARFDSLKTISKVPTESCVWRVHHDKTQMGVAYMYGDAVVRGDCADYVRVHNIVSADVQTVNPRVKLELMGVSMLDRSTYEDSLGVFVPAPHRATRRCTAHVNMKQLRIYVDRPTLTHSMKKRAASSSARWSCQRYTLLNTHRAKVCVACKRGK